MTNEHVANIAITVTAAMLATVAVVFTVSGNAPIDPHAADLPLISAGTAAARSAGSGASASAASSSTTPPSGSSTTVTARAASRATKPGGGSTAVASGSSASILSGGSASLTGSSAGKSHDSDDDEDHEVVIPKVHESDKHDRDAKDIRGTAGSRKPAKD